MPAMPPANPHKIYGPIPPRPQDGLSKGLTDATLRVNPHVEITHARAARVSLADCFALGGKGTGGLNPPGYSKTVLRTENVAAAPHPFKLSPF